MRKGQRKDKTLRLSAVEVDQDRGMELQGIIPVHIYNNNRLHAETIRLRVA